MRYVIVAALAFVTCGFVYFNFLGEKTATVSGSGRSIEVAVILPRLEGSGLIGEKVFNAKCVSCHGENAGGLDGAGPPFVHKIYEPSHHGDQAFVMAAKRGVQSHHWPFGDMPPVMGITDAEIASVIAYVRTLQRANGIK